MNRLSFTLMTVLLACPLAVNAAARLATPAGKADHPYLFPHFERVLQARPATGQIVIDGRIDPAWQAAEELSGFYSGRRMEILSPTTHVRAAYDANNVYFLIRCDEDPNYTYSQTVAAEENSEVWRDDCVELFLDPQYNQREFYQFTVSAGGGWLQVRQELPWQAHWQRAARVGENGWVAEIAIPLSAMSRKIKPRDVWGVNFARNRVAGKQESTFSPVVRGHKAPGRFQQMIFLRDESHAEAKAICDAIRHDATQRFAQRQKQRATLSGPPYKPAPGEIQLHMGKRLEIAGRMYEITELTQPENRMPAYPFYYDVYDLPQWQQMRDRYDFDEFVGDAKDELEILIRLREWVVRNIKTARAPAATTMDLFDILDKSIAGEKFFCQHQVQVFAQLAASYGFQVRVIGCPGHISAEVWIDKFGKWVWMDARWNFHWAKNGQPLSVIEMRREYWKNVLADCELLRGLEREEVYHSSSKTPWGKTWKSYFVRDNNSPLNKFKYSWVYSVNANDFFARKREHSPALRYLLCDAVIDEQMIAADANQFARLRSEHGAYGYSDINASADQRSWTLNTVTLHAYPHKDGLEFRFETYTPNFDRFEIVAHSSRISQLSVKDEPFIWRPGMGEGFSVRAVNKFHRPGQSAPPRTGRWTKIRLKTFVPPKNSIRR